jgi:hypothetical protein
MPAEGPAAPRPERTRVRRDAQPAAALQGEAGKPGDAAQDAPGQFYVDTYVSTPVQRALGARTIKTPGDLAAATRYLYDSAVERFDAIVTDKDGKPLAVVGNFKGALSQTSVYPPPSSARRCACPARRTFGSATTTRAATRTCREADKRLNATLSQVFQGSGIQPMGIIAVGAGQVRLHSVEHKLFPRESGLNAPDPAASGTLEVPVYERNQRDDRVAKRVLTNPRMAKAVAQGVLRQGEGPGHAAAGRAERRGRLGAAGWRAHGAPARHRRPARAVQGVSRGNFAAVIFVHAGELDAKPAELHGNDPVMNIGAALRPLDVRVLDAINVNKPGARNGMESRAELGIDNIGHTAYALGGNIWRSDLEDAIAAGPVKAAPAKGWLDFLAGLPKRGIKPAEIEWSGIRDWLQLQQGKVTREDVLGFLSNNGVKVTEVLKGGDGPANELNNLTVQADSLGYTFDRERFDQADTYLGGRDIVFQRRSDGSWWQLEGDRLYQLDDQGSPDSGPEEDREAYQPSPDITAVAASIARLQGEEDRRADENGTQYRDWTFPGGENYRELLITLPPNESKLPKGDPYHVVRDTVLRPALEKVPGMGPTSRRSRNDLRRAYLARGGNANVERNATARAEVSERDPQARPR